MTFYYRFFLIILILMFVLTASAKEKPLLSVKFKITERNYQDYFRDQIQRIEEEATKKIITALRDYYVFLNLTENESADSLIITLHNRQEATHLSQLREVGFFVTIRGTHISGEIDPVYWKFRPMEEYNRPLGTVSGFIREVTLAFTNNLSERKDMLVERLFSKIIIANNPLSIRDHLIWILPFSKEDLGINDFSQFLIEVGFREPFGLIKRRFVIEATGVFDSNNDDVLNEYYLGILTEAIQEQGHLEDIRGNTPMEVQELYIIKYIPYYGDAITTVSPVELSVEEEDVEP
ncbi:MAG: hypothetical protein KAS53_07600 [Candidatus Cloacimonetes bacterium]|nr:hypothetical protein [Candidatus Cloacimonadota bacterium]MCK5609822.1 hypothetical protein [Candidatus Pacearchaeota archaeon]